MCIRDRFSAVDHTALAQDATWEQVKELCDQALKFHTASVCIPPSYVARAKEYLGERMAVCTVIGFPNGYQTRAVKAFETRDAIANGADEIDMVINIGDLKDGRLDAVREEIKELKDICGSRILKVIIETLSLIHIFRGAVFHGHPDPPFCEGEGADGGEFLRRLRGSHGGHLSDQLQWLRHGAESHGGSAGASGGFCMGLLFHSHEKDRGVWL